MENKNNDLPKILIGNRKMKPEAIEYFKSHHDELYWFDRIRRLDEFLFGSFKEKFNSKAEQIKIGQKLIDQINKLTGDEALINDIKEWINLTNNELEIKFKFYNEKYSESCNMMDNAWDN